MRPLRYFFAEAFASLWRSPGPAAMSIVTIATGLFVLGLLLLVNVNAQHLVQRWSESAEVSAYLAEDATAEQITAVKEAAARSGVAAAWDYVSREQALTRFQADYPDLAGTAAGLGSNPFPASVEIRLSSDADTAGIEPLVSTLRQMPGVADVRYDRQWLQRLNAVVRGVRIAGLVVVIILSLAAAMTVANVVRLAATARSDEIEILELVGAPFAYVRGPMVAEGILQGGVGAALALGALAAGVYAFRLKISALAFLPAAWVALVLVGGMALGCLGGYVAARQVR